MIRFVLVTVSTSDQVCASDKASVGDQICVNASLRVFSSAVWLAKKEYPLNQCSHGFQPADHARVSHQCGVVGIEEGRYGEDLEGGVSRRCPPKMDERGELRDRLRELNRELRPGSGETSLQSMKKDQLVEEAKKLGINVTSNSTKGSLMRSIRAVREVTTGEDETNMGFGKYAEEMFKTVAQDHPEYVKWAKEVVEEDPKGCNPKLARFVKWVTLKDAATKQAGEVTEFYIGEKPTSSPPVCGFQPASSALSVKSMAKNTELAIEISYKSSAGSTFGKRRPSEKTEELEQTNSSTTSEPDWMKVMEGMTSEQLMVMAAQKAKMEEKNKSKPGADVLYPSSE